MKEDIKRLTYHLKKDVMLFEKHKLMDYSLLLAIEKINDEPDYDGMAGRAVGTIDS